MRLTNARLEDATLVDLTIEAGRIAAISPATGRPGDIDLESRLLLPALTDGHVHLDKTVLGMPWRPNSGAPTVAGRVENERRLRRSLTPVPQRAAALLHRMIASGTTRLRTHADIDDDIGLDNFHALQAVIAQHRAEADIELVAFPQSGILRRPRVADLLDAALAEGADLIGGLDPASYDGDARAHLDIVFAFAEKHGKGIDIHLHDRDPGGNAQLRDIAARTEAAGMAGQVTVSHAFSLGTQDEADFAATATALAKAGVAILTSSPSAGPVPPVKPLLAHGVTLRAGSDNIRDLWSPFGNGCMIERAMLICLRQGFRTDADIALAYDLCCDSRRLAAGAQADFIAIAAETRAEAVAERPARMVFRNGSLIAQDGTYLGKEAALF
jgi:cytosine deaminase